MVVSSYDGSNGGSYGSGNGGSSGSGGGNGSKSTGGKSSSGFSGSSKTAPKTNAKGQALRADGTVRACLKCKKPDHSVYNCPSVKDKDEAKALLKAYFSSKVADVNVISRYIYW